MKKGVLILLLSFLLVQVSEAKAKYSVLIVTGQSNHNWENGSSALNSIFSASPMFEPEIFRFPAKGECNKNYKPAFKKYDVVVLVYNGEAWSEKTQTGFERYVKSGGGVVVYHEADNSFPEWTAYNEIIGLGGWGNRTEKDGPYVYWKNGKIVHDNSPGNGGTHGRQSEVLVETRVDDHPITNGLPEKWVHATDELYGLLRGPALNMEVLATAYSDPKTNGTGRHEPCLFTVQYGKGRIFHTVFGHAGNRPLTAMECVGFQTTLLRGAEWAATGKVTQDVPSNFPTESKVELQELTF